VAWIEVMPEEEAQGELAEAYRRIAGSRGKMANITRVQSLNPDSMCVHLDLYLAVTFDPSGLSRNEREVIAVVVSEVNGCAYCVAHHGEALCHYWQDRERVEQAAQDFRALELPERTRRVLAYAKKLTCAPHEMKEGGRAPPAGSGPFVPRDPQREPDRKLLQLREPHRPGPRGGALPRRYLW